MKWIKDNTGRFSQRPFYEIDELNYECESVTLSFLQGKHGTVTFPITTNDLTILLEQKTCSLDLFADLTSEGKNIEGMTVFTPHEFPSVFIDRRLSEQAHLVNRLRTTISHELGHVVLHNFLPNDRQLSFFDNPSKLTIKCNRDSIITSTKVDWMEWQAGFASGAFLMPISSLRSIVQDVFAKSNSPSILMSASPIGQLLITQIQATFQVSSEAARVRLEQLGFLTKNETPQTFMK